MHGLVPVCSISLLFSLLFAPVHDLFACPCLCIFSCVRMRGVCMVPQFAEHERNACKKAMNRLAAALRAHTRGELTVCITLPVAHCTGACLSRLSHRSPSRMYTHRCYAHTAAQPGSMSELLRAVSAVFATRRRANEHYAKLLSRATPRVLRSYASLVEVAHPAHLLTARPHGVLQAESMWPRATPHQARG